MHAEHAFALAVVAATVSSALLGGEGAQAAVEVVVSGPPGARVSKLLFGQMMERANWAGEIGAELAWDAEKGTWRAGFLELMEELRPTCLRFPGGKLADYRDWRDFIDNVPGRVGPRPPEPGQGGTTISRNVGVDEFLRLCQRIGSEPILVVNVGQFVNSGRIAEGARLAADWVEYCNAKNDGSNPGGGVDWAAVRAKNGHPEPYGVRLWQLGNEAFGWLPRGREELYGKACAEYVKAMKAVDPSIEIIAEGHSPAFRQATLAAIGDDVDYLCVHAYGPWRITQTGLSLDEAWRGYVSLSLAGGMQGFFRAAQELREKPLGHIKLALTEWNWNGFWRLPPGHRPPPLGAYARALGAMTFFHDVLRRADVCEIACVSMLVGHGWGITTLRAPRDPQKPIYPFPSFEFFTMYRRNTGDRLLNVEVRGAPTYDVTKPLGTIRTAKGLSCLDVVATVDERFVYVAAINRHLRQALRATVRLNGCGVRPAGEAEIVWIAGDPETEHTPDNPRAIRRQRARAGYRNSVLEHTFPPRSATILKFPVR